MDGASSTTIDERVLRALVQADTNVAAGIAGQDRGFVLRIRCANHTQKTLVTSRGAVRVFASLDTAAAFAKAVGLPRFSVDMTEHEPGRLRGPRPDRAEALRQTRTRLHQQPLEFTV